MYGGGHGGTCRREAADARTGASRHPARSGDSLRSDPRLRRVRGLGLRGAVGPHRRELASGTGARVTVAAFREGFPRPRLLGFDWWAWGRPPDFHPHPRRHRLSARLAPRGPTLHRRAGATEGRAPAREGARRPRPDVTVSTEPNPDGSTEALARPPRPRCPVHGWPVAEGGRRAMPPGATDLAGGPAGGSPTDGADAGGRPTLSPGAGCGALRPLLSHARRQHSPRPARAHHGMAPDGFTRVFS